MRNYMPEPLVIPDTPNPGPRVANALAAAQ